MWLNKFSVRVPQGKEEGGYVSLRHKQRYTLILRNNRTVQCDARVEIDGKHAGTWRIYAHSNIELERPEHDESEFTFYKVGSKAARKAQLDEGDPSLGLIKVTFTPEKQWNYVTQPVLWGNIRGLTGSNTTDTAYVCSQTNSSMPITGMSAGGTGLSGRSTQKFVTVSNITHDFSQETVIFLRLVSRETNGARPLMAHSTPIPPRV